MAQVSKYCVIGIPDHEGVANVGGRIGAARGPESFRKAYYKLRGRQPIASGIVSDQDVMPISKEVAENHEAAARQIAELHRQTPLSLVIGGGHDHGFSHLKGIQKALGLKPEELGVINIDSHLDVRKPNPFITSGAFYYLSIESKILLPQNMIAFGIQSHCNSKELWDYAENKKINIIEWKQLRHKNIAQIFSQSLHDLSKKCKVIVLSLDLDSIEAASSPGVSAPQIEGFLASNIIEMMEIAGSNPSVSSLGIFELNPQFDVDDRTAKLAATAAWHFIESRSALC